MSTVGAGAAAGLAESLRLPNREAPKTPNRAESRDARRSFGDSESPKFGSNK